MEHIDIRPALASEIDAVVAIEHSAAKVFAELGYRSVVDMDPQPRSLYEETQADGGLFVATDADQIVGFACWSNGSGIAHLEEIDVAADQQGKGVGSKLLDAVIDAASEAGCSAVTLTTFVDVPFNKPWYERFGFVALDEDELSPTLAAHRAHERALGLDFAPRCAMRRTLTS